MKKILYIILALVVITPLVTFAGFFDFLKSMPVIFGDGNVYQKDQWTSTTSPSSSITQTVFGKTIRITGLSDGCLGVTSGIVGSSGSACGTGSSSSFGNSEVTHMYSFGDSITVSPSYVDTIASELNYDYTNNGYAGCTLEESCLIDEIYGTTISTTTVSTMLTGFNNHRYYSTDSLHLSSYKRALPSAIAYLAIPEASKKWASDSTVTRTGTWSATSTYGLTNRSYQTSTLNDTASTTLVGQTLFISGTQIKTGGGEFSVIVDGTTTYGPYSCTSGVQTIGYSGLPVRAYSPFMIQIDNLTSGTHYVTVKLTSSGYCQLDWLAGLSRDRARSGASVYIGNSLRQPSTGNLYNPPAQRLYNKAIGGIVKNLARAGLNVSLVDADNAYVPETMTVDLVHPNTYGHEIIAKAFLEKMSNVVTAQEKQGGSFFDSNTPSFSFGTYPSVFSFDMDSISLGIGTSSPGQKLSVAGDILGDNIIGSYFTSTSTTGVNSFNGSVGIGTSSPSKKLEISNGDLSIMSPSGQARGLIISTDVMDDTSRPAIRFLRNNFATFLGDDHTTQIYGFLSALASTRSFASTMRIYGPETGGFANYTSITHDGSDGILSTNIGDLVLSPITAKTGIGTTSPRGKLEITGDTTSTSNSVVIAPASGNRTLWIDGNNIDVRLTNQNIVSSVANLLLQSAGGAGNVGIGTTSPYAKLSVSGEIVTANINATSTTATSTIAGPLRLGSTGSNPTQGNVTLVGGTATVTTGAAVSTGYVHLTRKTSGGTIGTAITYTITNGSFTITSDNVLDTSTFTWMVTN